MKYMNNHYGVSRVFGNAHFKMPVDIDGGEGGAGGGGAGGSGASGDAGADGKDGAGDGGKTGDRPLDTLCASFSYKRCGRGNERL